MKGTAEDFSSPRDFSTACYRGEHSDCSRPNTCGCKCHRLYGSARTTTKRAKDRAKRAILKRADKGSARSVASTLNLMIDMLNAPPIEQTKGPRKPRSMSVYLVWRAKARGKGEVVAMVAGTRERALSKAIDVAGRVERRRVWF